MVDQIDYIRKLTYSGRGVHALESPQGGVYLGYSLSGRSPFSQARKLVLGEKTGTVSVQPVTDDTTLMKMFDIQGQDELKNLKGQIADGVAKFAPLIYYAALAPWTVDGKVQGVAGSNGSQTNVIYSFMQRGKYALPETILEAAFEHPSQIYGSKNDEWIDETSFEPDGPHNFTSRVDLVWLLQTDPAFSAVRCIDGKRVLSQPYRAKMRPDLMHSLFTYKGGNESPRLLPSEKELTGVVYAESAKDLCESLYASIRNPNPADGNKRYGVAAVVMHIREDGTMEKPIIKNYADEIMSL